METYDKSILKYRDVRSAVELAKERYYERGIKQGSQKEREAIARKCFAEGMSIDLVSRITGLSLEQLIEE